MSAWCSTSRTSCPRGTPDSRGGTDTVFSGSAHPRTSAITHLDFISRWKTRHGKHFCCPVHRASPSDSGLGIDPRGVLRTKQATLVDLIQREELWECQTSPNHLTKKLRNIAKTIVLILRLKRPSNHKIRSYSKNINKQALLLQKLLTISTIWKALEIQLHFKYKNFFWFCRIFNIMSRIT